MHHKYVKLWFFSNIWRSIFSGNKELAHYLSAMAQGLLSNLNYCGRSNFLILLWKHWTVKDQNWFLFRVNFARGGGKTSSAIELNINIINFPGANILSTIITLKLRNLILILACSLVSLNLEIPTNVSLAFFNSAEQHKPTQNSSAYA